MTDRINIGDFVHVDFNNSQFTLCSRAEVLYMPAATGDSWIFKKSELHNPEDKTIYYVSEGCTITKL